MLSDTDLLAAVFVRQVERFAKQAAYEAEPAAWRAPALREPSPDIRPAASPSLWESVAPPAFRPPARVPFLAPPPAAEPPFPGEGFITNAAFTMGSYSRGNDGIWRQRCTCLACKLRITPGSRRNGKPKRARRRLIIRTFPGLLLAIVITWAMMIGLVMIVVGATHS